MSGRHGALPWHDVVRIGLERKPTSRRAAVTPGEPRLLARPAGIVGLIVAVVLSLLLAFVIFPVVEGNSRS